MQNDTLSFFGYRLQESDSTTRRILVPRSETAGWSGRSSACVVSVVRGKQHADLQMPRVTFPPAFTTFRNRNAMQAGIAQIAGSYELSVTQRALTITLEGGKLFGLPEGGDKRKITPESDDLFDVEGAPFKLRFVRDEKGAITYFQMLVNGEEVQRGTKLK